MSSEQRGFVFSVVFIIIFSSILATIPAGLQGPEESPDLPIPVDPLLVTDFSVTANYTRTDFIGGIYYVYDLGGRTWVCSTDGAQFALGAKVLVAGVVWLGQLDSVKFVDSDGEDRGGILTLGEIEADAIDGTVRYALQYIGTGNSAGGFVVYWNTTTYTNPTDAWTADKLYLLHGMGIDSTSTINIATLLLSLLFLQLPDVPFLVNVLIVVPIWATIIYVIWYLIKEMIPFL